MKNGLELGPVITWPQCVEIEKNQTEAQLATVADAAAAAAATESGKQVGKNVASTARKESSENTLRNATLS